MSSIDDYEQGERIGAGGFADVYQARRLSWRKSVALKISRPDDESRARIRREIEVQRRFSHPNIMKILDWDRDGHSWLVMELAEGSLGKIHDQRSLTEAEVIRFLEEVLAGLGAAHRRGFVHRDLSPGNILRTRGHWVLADWGYVNDPDASKLSRLTRTGTRGGTFTWAAPEMLVDAHRADARADLYALGKIASWLLTGKIPAPGKAPELPEPEYWRKYLGRLTEDDPIERPRSAEEALASLEPITQLVPGTESEEVAPAADGSQDATAASVSALKRYIVSPEHKIRLFDLVTQTTEEAVRGVTSERFGASNLERGDELLARLQDYHRCCRPLMHLLFAGAHFGEEAHEELWTRCVQRLADTYKLSGGNVAMKQLQRLPGTLAMNAAAFGAVVSGNYRNLAAVTTRPVCRTDSQEEASLIGHFGTNSVLPVSLLQTIKRFERRKLPGNELMFEFLGELGRGFLISDEELERFYDKFEIVVGLLAISENSWATGLFALRNGPWGVGGKRGMVARLKKEFQAEGSAWGPLAAGLFGGEPKRVEDALVELEERANRIAQMLHAAHDRRSVPAPS
jgi:Protein kinase domain